MARSLSARNIIFNLLKLLPHSAMWLRRGSFLWLRGDPGHQCPLDSPTPLHKYADWVFAEMREPLNETCLFLLMVGTG